MKRISLLVEGDGDMVAVPEMLRRNLALREMFDVEVLPSPTKVGEVPKLRRAGMLENQIQYADTKPGEIILLILDLDCAGCCPIAIGQELAARIAAIKPAVYKRVGIGFVQKEFESIFLPCLPTIAAAHPEFGWKLDGFDPDRDFETVRGAKELIEKYMRNDRRYKETTDQVRFLDGVDWNRLEKHSRSYRHFLSLLDWIADHNASQIYPPMDAGLRQRVGLSPLAGSAP